MRNFVLDVRYICELSPHKHFIEVVLSNADPCCQDESHLQQDSFEARDHDDAGQFGIESVPEQYPVGHR